ncbi:hypothetical protein [Nocardia sp. NPDC004722]
MPKPTAKPEPERRRAAEESLRRALDSSRRRNAENSRRRTPDNAHHRTPDNGHHRTPDNGHHRTPDNARHRAAEGKRRITKPVAILVGAMAVSIALVVAANSRHGGTPATPPAVAAQSPAALTTDNPHATTDCRATSTADTVTGAGPGDPATGPGAILGFEWAYYNDRSGTRAREWVTSDAEVPAAATIQAGIDATPEATRYCVQITRASADGTGVTWNVTLAEQYPTDKTPQQWAQIITTANIGDRVLITGIRKAH